MRTVLGLIVCASACGHAPATAPQRCEPAAVAVAAEATVFAVDTVYFSPVLGFLYVDVTRGGATGDDAYSYTLMSREARGYAWPTEELVARECGREPRGCAAIVTHGQALLDRGSYAALPRQAIATTVPGVPIIVGAYQVVVRDGLIETSGAGHDEPQFTMLEANARLVGVASAPRDLAVVLETSRRTGDVHHWVTWMASTDDVAGSDLDLESIYFSAKTGRYLFVESSVDPDTGRRCTLTTDGNTDATIRTHVLDAEPCWFEAHGSQALFELAATMIVADAAVVAPDVEWPEGAGSVRIDAYDLVWEGERLRVTDRTTGRSSRWFPKMSPGDVPTRVALAPDARALVVTFHGDGELIEHLLVDRP